MRTPDSTAGKKGKCPHCGAVTSIPWQSETAAATAWNDLAAALPATSDGRSRDPVAADKIDFPCAQCGWPVRTPVSAAGKKGKCPSCGAVVQIPSQPPVLAPAPPAAANVGAGRTSSPAPAKPEGKAEVRCPQCAKILRIPAHAVGRTVRCSDCGNEVSTAAAKPAPARTAGAKPAAARSMPVAGLTPLSGATSGLTPLAGSDSGLTPLPDAAPGLTPLPDAVPGLTPLSASDSGLTPPPDAGPGLTPLPGAVPGLTPLPANAPGLTPLPAAGAGLTPFDMGLPALDPVAALGPSGGLPAASQAGAAGSPFAASAASSGGYVNPYQSPSVATAYRPRSGGQTSRGVIMAPAIAMIVISGLTLFLLVILGLIQIILFAAAAAKWGLPELDAPRTAGQIAGFVILLGIQAVILSGARKMLKCQAYGQALTAAILCILPCTAAFLGVPIGIWAVIVLCLPGVRTQFS